MLLTAFWCLFLATEPAWQWPIEPKFGVSATFGEYRGERFHMGLDFSTGGAEGMILRPARDGVVFQVRASQSGYGKAVYVRHADGFITVYAHLAAFGKGLQAAIRDKGRDPAADFGTLALAYPVKHTETLAWTGESGAGMPHLHFEVRDADNRPRDPLNLPFPKLSAPIRPVIRGLRLLPLNADARVGGGAFPRVFGTVDTVIQARGRLGLQVDAYLAAPRDNTLAPRGVRVLLDGRELAVWRPQQIHFDHYRQAGSVLDQAFSGFGPTRYWYAFDDRTAVAPVPPGLRVDGVLDLGDQPRTLRVEIWGFDGAVHGHTWTLDPDKGGARGRPDPDLPIQPTSLRVRCYGDRFFIQPTALAGTLVLPSEMRAMGPGDAFEVGPTDDSAPVSLIWRTDAGSLTRRLAWLSAGETDLGPFRLRVADSAFAKVGVLVQPADPKQGKGVLEFESSVLSFGRHGLPAAGVRLVVDDAIAADTEVALYYWSFVKKRWRYHSALVADKEGVSIDVLTPLVLARDRSAPTIRAPKIHRYFVGNRVVIPIVERGSGIDRDSVAVRGPSGNLPARYDGDRGWIILEAPADSGPWHVSVRDRAGLKAEVKQLRIPSR